MPSHFEPHDHDYDGRPSVGYWEEDPLLERLCRYHPERIPAELRVRFRGDYVRTRAPRVAAALSLHAIEGLGQLNMWIRHGRRN